MATPLGQIDTLGDMAIEKGTGRLLVKGGYGKAEAIIDKDKGCADPTNPPGGFDAIDNNCWFDDTSDGPVTATVVFDDNSTSEVVAGWFVCTDPGFAPQVRNVVSAWDDMFDVWVRELDLMPNLYSNGQFNPDYQPPFDSELQPIFHGAMLQQWSTALPSQALNGHKFVGVIKPSDDPSVKLPNFEQLIRNPDDADNDGLVPMNYTGKQSTTTQNRMMPLALGDAMKSFLTLSPSQYFFMKQWRAGKSTTKEPLMGIGEQLDRAVLENCLGGRYSPGIDVTFIIRDVNLYIQKWRGATGPFRFNMQPMDYTKATKGSPFLGVGYLPLRTAKVEPGDICKFMSLPWHTDYNSCAIHEPDPNPEVGVDQGGTHGTTQMANTLYWSWPAQRPVQIYPKDLCTYDADTKTWSIGGQLFSVRGDGTLTDFPQKRGAYQDYFTFIKDWHMVGFVLQGTQVPDDHGGDYGADKFIEVKSLFTDVSDPVTPWPSGFNVIPESPTS